MTKISYNRVLDIAVIIVVIALYCFFSSRLFLGDFLWYDEAGQYYIAKGLFHYSDPFAPYSGISDVLYYNRYFNKDPGGFGVLLHYWSMISNHYIWLRFLPLLFYSFTLYLSYIIGKKYIGNSFIAILVTSVFLFHPVFGIEACEIRAYSMEMLGVMLSLYYFIKSEGNWKYKEVLILAFILAVFMTSRYSFVIYAFSLSLFFAYSLLKKESLGRFFIIVIPYGAILLLSVLIIYLLSVQYQFSESGQGYVEYGYLGRNIKALLSLTCIRFYILIGIAYYYYKKYKHIDSCVVIAIIASCVFIILSSLNLYPLDERRSMSLTVIQYFSIGVALVKIFNNEKCLSLAKLFVLVISVVLMIVFPMLNKGRSEQDEKYEEFKNVISELKKGKSIYVHRYIAPGIRYSLEEGALRTLDRNIYKNCIYLAKDKTHSPCEELHYEIIKPEEYDASFYLLQELPNLFVIDHDIFIPYKGMHHVYIKK